MECFSSLLLLFCILPVLLMFTYPISIFLFCSCSTLVLLLLVIVASSFCGKKLLAMETTSNRVFHHCVVAPSFCGKKNFLQWKSSTRSRVPPLCCCFFFCEKEASCNGNYISSNLAALMMIPSLLQHKVPAASKTCNSKTASKPALKSRSFPLLCVHASLSLSLSVNFWVHGPLYTRCNAHSKHSSVSITIRSYCCCWGCPTICYLRLVAADSQYQGRKKKHIQIL